MTQAKMIMVEMGGTRKSILESSLPEAQKMAEEMYNLAIKGGFSEEMAKELFTLRIVKEGE
jgi:hypothetical protein